jgi:hypothetical protein
MRCWACRVLKTKPTSHANRSNHKSC